MTTLVALCGTLVGAGLWMAATAADADDLRSKVPVRRRIPPIDRGRLTLAIGAGLGALVLTRWPVAAVGAGTAGWFFTRGGAAARRAETERTDALAMWAELLRDAIGSARGIEGILVSTAPAAPVTIRAEALALRDRLAPSRAADNGHPARPQSLDDALDALARDLDHPIGDLIVTALRVTAVTGGGRTREVLADVAAAAHAQAEALRRIEVARERPRAAMRYTAIVVAVVIALLVAFSSDFLDAYDTGLGQLVLLFVGAYWAFGFWWMHRMGRMAAPERFFAARRRPAAPSSGAGS